MIISFLLILSLFFHSGSRTRRLKWAAFILSGRKNPHLHQGNEDLGYDTLLFSCLLIQEQSNKQSAFLFLTQNISIFVVSMDSTSEVIV